MDDNRRTVTVKIHQDSSDESDESVNYKVTKNSLKSLMLIDTSDAKSRTFFPNVLEDSNAMANQEHARPRTDSRLSWSETSSLASSIDKFRFDFDDMKRKMQIFGESLKLCKCIGVDFDTKVSQLDQRLRNLEKRQNAQNIESDTNYSYIIMKNKKLSSRCLNEAKKLQMCGTEEEMREVAGRICRNYLHGAWKTVDASELNFRRISGGLSNFLYYVALPEDVTKAKLRETTSIEDTSYINSSAFLGKGFTAEEPKQVLLRIYGQVHGERAMDAIVTESVIFTLLSERRLGPKLHGVFSGGRIEEFIPARPLLTKELAEPALSMKIAEKMAAIHSLDIPLSKEPNWLWKTMGKWLKTVKEERLTVTLDGKSESEIMARLKTIDFDSEIEWLKKFLATVESPVVFCHNDMQEGNILMLEDSVHHDEDMPTYGLPSYEDGNTVDSESSNISDSGEPKLVFIDFEYCAYNYRGFDIANHFQEWEYDYTNPEHPNYYNNRDNCPSLEQKEIFIREYLKHAGSGPNKGAEPSIDDVNHLLNEVDAFALASHLFWCLWSVVNASKSQIPFGYWEYAISRLDTYLRLKQEVMKKDNHGPQKRKICEVDI